MRFLTWAFPDDEAREEKHTRVTFEIEEVGHALPKLWS